MGHREKPALGRGEASTLCVGMRPNSRAARGSGNWEQRSPAPGSNAPSCVLTTAWSSTRAPGRGATLAAAKARGGAAKHASVGRRLALAWLGRGHRRRSYNHEPRINVRVRAIVRSWSPSHLPPMTRRTGVLASCLVSSRLPCLPAPALCAVLAFSPHPWSIRGSESCGVSTAVRRSPFACPAED